MILSRKFCSNYPKPTGETESEFGIGLPENIVWLHMFLEGNEENYGFIVPAAFRTMKFGNPLESTRNIHPYHEKDCCGSFCACGAEF